jgi:hypothetical protein
LLSEARCQRVISGSHSEIRTHEILTMSFSKPSSLQITSTALTSPFLEALSLRLDVEPCWPLWQKRLRRVEIMLA